MKRNCVGGEVTAQCKHLVPATRRGPSTSFRTPSPSNPPIVTSPAQTHSEMRQPAVSAAGLAGVTGALVEAPSRGIGDPVVLVAGVIGVAGLAAFVRLQVGSADPLVPPSLFGDRTFTLANALTFAVYAALGGVFLLLVVQLQISLGYSPTVAGAAGLPDTVIMLLLSGRSGALAQRIEDSADGGDLPARG